MILRSGGAWRRPCTRRRALRHSICVAWLVPVAVALAVTGCGHRRKAARPHEVVFWHSLPPAVMQTLILRFEKDNPDVHVTAVEMPDSTSADSAAAAVVANAPPDLCQLHGRDLPPFLAHNWLSDWSAGVADLRPGLRGWEMCMLGDAIYGLPWVLSTEVLWFDRALFARARLDTTRTPATWNELRSAANRIERLHGGVHGYGLPVGREPRPLERFMPWAWSNGGDLLSAGLDSAQFDSPANVRALEFLASLRAASRLGSEDTLEHEFGAGHVGLLVADSRLRPRFAGTSIGSGAIPGPTASGTTAATGEVLVSFTGSRHKEDALRLARFLVQPENARALASAITGTLPSARDSTLDERSDPLAHARFLPNVRNRTALEDTLQTLLDDAILGRRNAADALAAADSFMTTHLGVK